MMAETLFWWAEWQRNFIFLVQLVWAVQWLAVPDNVTSLQECAYALINPIELNYLVNHIIPDFVECTTSQLLKVARQWLQI